MSEYGNNKAIYWRMQQTRLRLEPEVIFENDELCVMQGLGNHFIQVSKNGGGRSIITGGMQDVQDLIDSVTEKKEPTNGVIYQAPSQ